MALPASADFTGSNGTDIRTLSDWDGCDDAGGAGLEIQSNAAQGIISNRQQGCWWTTDAFNANQYSTATVAAIASGTYVGVGVRMSGTDNGGDYTAYHYVADSADGDYLEEYDGGSYTGIASGSNTFSVSDVIYIEADGTSLTCKLNGGTTLTSTGETALSSGAAGISAYSDGNSRVDDWEGGNLGAAAQGITPDTISSAASVYSPTVSPGAVTITPDAIASTATVYAPTVSAGLSITPDTIASAATVYDPTIAPGAVSITPDAIASVETVYTPTVSVGAATIVPDTIASVETVYPPTISVGAVTITPDTIASIEQVESPDVLTAACINGVLTVNATNARYVENDDGVLVLGGFHTWYDVQDGGSSDPPAAFDWDEYLAALVSYGCNLTKLWVMETARDWPDVSGQYYTPHPWARTGPGTAADGKDRFDLTTWDETYFARLRTRAIEAGNAGVYCIVQLFQGWHIDLKGFSAGDPWGYHPFEDGNNINSIDGDTDNDGGGTETRDTSFTAVYNLQKAYVEKVIDTVNDLDNIIYEIANEETYSATTLAWERALAVYVTSYESGLSKQHLVGITKLWPGGSNANLFGSTDADWISIDDDYPTPDPDEADGSKVIIYDTDHIQGLTSQYQWVLQSFAQGNNPFYMDEWDGALYGSDRRSDSDYQLIRRLTGAAVSYAAQMDLENATPQGSLSETGWCLAKTTGSAQLFVYQDGTGAFDVYLTSLSGTFSLEWYRVSTGATQAGTDVSGGATRTLTPPWSGAVAAFLEQTALLILLDTISSGETVYSPTVTPGAVTVTPDAIASAAQIYAPTVAVGAVTIEPDTVASVEAVYAPTLVVGAVTVEPDTIASAEVVYEPTVITTGSIVPDTINSVEAVYSPTVTPGAVSITPDAISSAEQVYEPTVAPGSVTIEPDTIASTETVYDVTVTQGTVIVPDTIVSAATVYEPTLTPGTVDITPDAVASSETVYEPTVQPGAVVVEPDAIGSVATVYEPTVAVGAATILLDAISSGATVYEPEITTGAVTIEPDAIESVAQVYEPFIGTGTEQTIAPDTIASAAQVYTVIILTIAAQRCFRVAAESRTFTVAADSRTFTVEAN